MKPKFNKKPKTTGGGPRNLIFAVVFFVLCLGLLTKLTDYTRNIVNLPYSTFLEKIEKNEVKSVTISGVDVSGVLKDGTHFETIVGEYQKHWDLLKGHNVEINVTNPNGHFNIWNILLLISFLMTPLAIWFFLRQAKGGSNGSSGGGGIFNMGKSRAKLFMPSTIKENFNSVAGAAEAKEELQDVVDFLKNPEKYRRLGAKITRGVLLIGEPGNGKTLMARAVAGEANCPFFSVSGSDFIEVFVGIGAARVRDLFAQARKTAPSIIFIDEIDAVGRHRGSGLGGGHDEREQTLNQLLTEMDGFETSNDPVIVLAATNRPDVLDKALLRPGRFDRRVDIPYPDLISREQILKVHTANIKIDPSVDLKKIARGTPGFSGADLANLINEAAIIASKQKDRPFVIMEDIEQARDKITIGKELKTIMLTEEDRKMIAFHEAGHALINLLMPKLSDPLHKVTIIPRGKALGVTHSMPDKEKYSHSKDEMLARVQMLLGGRAAEETVLNSVGTGAYSDFRYATDIVRRMICLYGMSDNLGKVIYTQSSDDFVYSQKTAEKIDEEVKNTMDNCYEKTKQLLIENRDKLDKLANALLEKETMYASEIYELLGIEPRVDFKLTE